VRRVKLGEVSHTMSIEEDIRFAIENKLRQTIDRIEETLNQLVKRRKLGIEDIRNALRGLKPSFYLLSQKWFLRYYMFYSSWDL